MVGVARQNDYIVVVVVVLAVCIILLGAVSGLLYCRVRNLRGEMAKQKDRMDAVVYVTKRAERVVEEAEGRFMVFESRYNSHEIDLRNIRRRLYSLEGNVPVPPEEEEAKAYTVP